MALSSLVVAVFLSEFVLRLFYNPQADPSDYRVPDPVVGWRLQPNARYVYQRWGFKATVDHNSQGWRDIEHDYHKNPGVFRIVVLGDSYLEAYTVDMQDAFHRRLEELANDSGHKAEVINLSVAGYGTLQEYLTFTQHGVKYSPDLVVLGFFVGNDLRNNSEILELLRFSEQDDIRTSRPFLQPGAVEDWQITRPDYDETLRRHHALREASSGRSWWKSSALYRLYEERRSRRRLEDRFKEEMGFSAPEPCAQVAEYEEAWEITRRILHRLAREVEDAGAELFIVAIPGPDGRHRLLLKRRDAAGHFRWCADAQAVQRLSAVAGEIGAGFLDLEPFLLAAHDRGTRLIVPSDRHWNAKGHEIAAVAVFDALVGAGLLSD